LLIPFGIKSLQSGLEIYPAIIFPAGAEKLNIKDEIRSFQNYELYGYKDTLQIIDWKLFLGEVPGQYFHSIIKGNFGLESYSHEFEIPFTQIKVSEKNYLNDKKIKEAKDWIKARLLEQGFSDSTFIVRKIQKNYNTNSKKLENQTIIYEKTFRLY
jgi:hypothetical protein